MKQYKQIYSWWLSYGDIRLGQGRENSKVYLKDNPDVALEIENQIRSKYNLPLAVAAPSEAKNEGAADIADETNMPTEE